MNDGTEVGGGGSRRRAVRLAAFPIFSRHERVDGVELIVIAIRRAPTLVPVAEANGLRFYLRTGEGRHPMPEYLHSDLLLGRRERPLVEVSTNVKRSPPSDPEQACAFTLCVSVTNVGFSWVERLDLGLVGLMDPKHGASRITNETLLGLLRRPPLPDTSKGAQPHHHRMLMDTAPMPPLRTERKEITLRFPKVQSADPTMLWMGGIYVAPHSGPPIWHQLTLLYQDRDNRLDDQPLEQLAEGLGPICWWGSEDEWGELDPVHKRIQGY